MILSDRVVLMNHGTIEQIGAPDEMWRSPKTFCAKFFGETNVLEGGSWNQWSGDDGGPFLRQRRRRREWPGKRNTGCARHST